MKLKLFFTIVFIIVSIISGLGLVLLTKALPKEKWIPPKNYNIIACFISIGVFFDFIMSIILFCFIGEGEYVGNGVAILVLLFYGGPFCIEFQRLKKRWPEKWRYHKSVNLVLASIIFKTALFVLADILINEVYR